MPRRLLLVSACVLTTLFIVTLLNRPAESVGASDRPLRSLETSRVSTATTLTTDTITIPTYPYAAHLYTATNTIYNIPYQWLHWGEYEGSHPQPVDQAYTRLTLENEWLRVSVLPQLGGRVYEFIYKPTGDNELYQNPVIKPTHWGPPEQGWWLAAGGIEWGLPVEEHGYESAIPWSYDVITGGDGITITVRDSTAPDRLRAAIAIFLPNDRAALIIRPRIENDRDVDLNFKWWLNAMLAPGPGNTVGRLGHNPVNIDVRFVFPIDQVTVHSTGDSSLPPADQPMAWPFYQSRDMSRLQNWGSWLGFFARPGASQDFAAVMNDNASGGLVRVFPRAVATGLKGFGMGYGNPIGAAEWTDDDSYYVELHGGLAATFGDSVAIGAHQAIEWEETWFDIPELDTVTSANRDAALEVMQTGIHVVVGAYSPRPLATARLTVWRRSTCERLGDFMLEGLIPSSAQYRLVPTTLPIEDLSVLFTQVDRVIASYNIPDDGTPPVVHANDFGGYATQPEFTVAWSGLDASCMRSYDVQVRDGYAGVWTTWLTATMEISHTFTGQDGHLYYFRARGRDLAGHESAYSGDEWGDMSVPVLITPQPLFDSSHFTAPRFVAAGRPIDYRFDLRNSGNQSGFANVTLTLPLSTTLITGTLTSGLPPDPVYDGETIKWSGTAPAGQIVFIDYALTPTVALPSGTVLTSTADVQGDWGTLTRVATTVVPYRTFLPVIMRTFSAP